MRAAIKGKRVTLRKLRKSDADKITEYCQDPTISRWTLSIPFPYKKKHAIQYIKDSPKKWKKKEAYNYAIIHKNELVGNITLMPKKGNNAELGYWVGRKHRGQGFATEAAKMLMKEGFKTLKLHKIFAWHMAPNKASGRVMQKIGLKYEATLKKHIQKGKKEYDLCYCGILRREFKG